MSGVFGIQSTSVSGVWNLLDHEGTAKNHAFRNSKYSAESTVYLRLYNLIQSRLDGPLRYGFKFWQNSQQFQSMLEGLHSCHLAMLQCLRFHHLEVLQKRLISSGVNLFD